MANNSNKYTSSFQVLTDVSMYMAVKRGDSLTLANVQSIAKNRWSWMVDNWNALYKRFKLFASGDQIKEATLEDFDRIVDSYNLGNTRNPFDTTSQFIDFSPFLDIVALAELTLSPEERILIEKEKDRVRQLSIDDFQDMIRYLKQRSVLASYAIGLGDDDGAALIGVLPAQRERTATIDDLIQMDDVQQITKFIEGIIIDLKQTRDKPPNLISIANNNLGDNTIIRFNDTYKSSIAVPFEIGLEHMAQKYLGSRDRYFELVTINRLQPPYVDEVGQKLLLLAPGAVNNIIVPFTLKTSMPVGTKIMIGSFGVREEPRIIERVVDNNDGTLIVFLSGAQDLAKLKTNEGAFIRVYAPHTVNTGSFIMIPLTTGSPNSAKFTPKSDELRRLDAALLNFGVDIARDEQTGGLLIDANGNLKFAAGFANVRQAVLYALKTSQGELPFHPDYGVTVNVGERYYGTTDEAVIFATALRKSLMKDPRFDDIQIAGIQTTNTGIALTMLVSIRGLGAPVPLSFVS